MISAHHYGDDGLKYIHIDGEDYRSDLLVWIYHYDNKGLEGKTIEHINGDIHDDKIENLRLVDVG